MERKALAKEKSQQSSGSYFVSQKGVSFYTSGAEVIDLCLGGGYPLGRFTNIIGDKSTGKTLMAIEACANFQRKFPDGKIWYCEVEAAFDEAYAQALGVDTKKIKFVPDVDTVEQWYADLSKRIEKLDDETPALYILDSFDALSDKAEMAREMGQGSYGTGKAKGASEMFRRITRRLARKKVHLIIISQVRDNIGVTFGRKVTRSGGKALDFYASQTIYLAHLGQIHKTKNGIKRPIGVQIRLKVDKNKVGLPFRECNYPIIFGYGIEDVTANLDWLVEHKRIGDIELSKAEAIKIKKKVLSMDQSEYKELRKQSSRAVRKAWYEIETNFLPTRGKYS